MVSETVCGIRMPCRWYVVPAVILMASLMQTLASQMTSVVFEHDFESPLCLTWFSMHALLFLSIPYVVSDRRVGANYLHVAGHGDLGDVPPRTEGHSAASAEEEKDDEEKADSVVGSTVVGLKEEGEEQRQRCGRHAASTSRCSYGCLQPEEAAVADALVTQTTLFSSSLLGAGSDAISIPPGGRSSSRADRRNDVFRMLLLYSLYVIANVTYVVALRSMSPALVSAIFCAAPAFVMLLSWPLLGRRIRVTDAVAVALGAGGVLLVAQPWVVDTSVAPSGGGGVNTEAGGGMINLLCAIASPLASALYKVCFARFYANLSWQRVGLRLSIIGCFNLAVGTPLLVLFLAAGGEPLPWKVGTDMSSIPWLYIAISMLASLFFNFFVNYGVTITFPLYVSVASLLSTGFNLSIDAAKHQKSSSTDAMNTARITGLILLVTSLLLLLVAAYIRSG